MTNVVGEGSVGFTESRGPERNGWKEGGREGEKGGRPQLTILMLLDQSSLSTSEAREGKV